MSKNNKRDAWTYLIVALLMANLFVINNYITKKAIVIIEAKNNASNHKTFNIETLKQGVTSKYIGIINSTKEVLGMEVVKDKISEHNSTTNNSTNVSKKKKVIGSLDQPTVKEVIIKGSLL